MICHFSIIVGDAAEFAGLAESSAIEPSQRATIAFGERRAVQATAMRLMANTDLKTKSAASTSENIAGIITADSSSSATTRSKTSPKWVVYCPENDRASSARQAIDSPAGTLPGVMVQKDSIDFKSSIPCSLRQDGLDASICFFFRHYAGTAFDPEALGFNQLWQPMYLRAATQSSLRLATAAVTINIAMMWSFRGCHTRPAQSLFTRAIAAARRTLRDPHSSSTDEILMTILIFDLYDALLLHYAPGPVDYGKHKQGALAMIEHRGFTNLETSQSRALIGAVRHTLLPYLLSSRKPFPWQSDYLFAHASVNDTKATKLDLLSLTLSRIQSRQWAIHLDSRHQRHLDDRRAQYEEIISEALGIEELLLDWKASIVDREWLPEYLARDAVMESIQNAGFYGTRCSVWTNLSIGGTWILFSFRYLLTLQIMRQSFADEVSLLDSEEHRELLSRVDESVQKLADFICETVPFYLGDTVVPKNPSYSAMTNFPYTFRFDQDLGLPIRFPSLGSNHQTQAAASGGWILFPQLVNLWRLAEPEDDAIPIVLREGQLDWIKQQVKRLQKIFLFCDPVWFKR
ncbi:altered inheritance of mitochondria protein 6 [Physcia stellaris]|nr:altered inheritance of mitochondria protein 6 [Physcia stellaris]